VTHRFGRDRASLHHDGNPRAWGKTWAAEMNERWLYPARARPKRLAAQRPAA